MNPSQKLVKPIFRLYYSRHSNHCRNLAKEIEESRYAKIVTYISVDEDPKTGRIPKVPDFVKGIPTIYVRNNKNQEVVFTGKRKCSDFVLAGTQQQQQQGSQQRPQQGSQQQQQQQQQNNPNLDTTGLFTFSRDEMSAFSTDYASIDGDSMNQSLNPFKDYQKINTPEEDGKKIGNNVNLTYQAPEIRRSDQQPQFQDQRQFHQPIGGNTPSMIDRQNYNPNQFSQQRPQDTPNFAEPNQPTRGNPDVSSSFEAMMAQREREDQAMKPPQRI